MKTSKPFSLIESKSRQEIEQSLVSTIHRRCSLHLACTEPFGRAQSLVLGLFNHLVKPLYRLLTRLADLSTFIVYRSKAEVRKLLKLLRKYHHQWTQWPTFKERHIRRNSIQPLTVEQVVVLVRLVHTKRANFLECRVLRSLESVVPLWFHLLP